MANNFFTISSLFYSVLLVIVYFFKQRINKIESRIYDVLVLLNLLTVIFALFSYFTISSMDLIPLINNIVSKTLLLCFYSWWTLFTIYIFVISSKTKNNDENIELFNKLKNIFGIISIFVAIVVYLLPLRYSNQNNVIYSYGESANFIFFIGGLYILSWIIVIFSKFKMIKSKKYLPAFLFPILIIICTILQKLNPGLLLVTAAQSFITFMMYFTIENPDLKMINQLELARDQADKANRAKTDFLSNMSHEIRTPLNAIVGFSECIETSKTLDDAKEDAKDIIMASKNLLEIVNGILDISKIEADKMEIVNVEYNLNEILENLSKLIMPRIEEKSIELRCNFAPDIPDNLYGDSGKVKQVITNVLTNAAKYTEEGYIDFNVSCVNNENVCSLVISIKDTGRGIKTEQMDKLFTKFQRLDEDKNTTTEGTGLGLAITKKLVEMMGGKIVVQSEYGEGSNFLIYLNQEIRNGVHEEETNNNTIFNLLNKNVLVVDDNKLNLKVANKILSEFNLNVTTLDSGFACINSIENKEKYDLILMDIMMPKMGGLETLKKLKEIDGFDTPVVALTADAINGKSAKYIEAGFNGYLTKPIDKLELNNLLVKILGNVESKVEVIKEDNEIESNNTFDVNFLKSKGIDVDHGLELLGDMEMYDETLETFISESIERLPKMKEFKETGDCANYAILAHAMKSDSKYLGFTKLAELSYNHEMEGKNNNQDYIEGNYDSLINEVNRILNVIKKYLKK